jgi:OmpA-OmpF porin, OOP family
MIVGCIMRGLRGIASCPSFTKARSRASTSICGHRTKLRRASAALAAAGALATALPASAADTEGWYGGLGGGWSSLDEIKLKISQPGGTLDAQNPTSNSAAVNGAFGYKFDPSIRLEAEVQYADFNMQRLPPPSPRLLGPKGDLGITTVYANALYDYHFSQRFAATIGAGVGAGLADANVPVNPNQSITSTGTGFAWQVIAGFTVALTDNLEIQADYRYQSIQPSDHDFNAMDSAATIGHKNIHSAMLNFRWFLSSPEAPPPPPPPLPPPPPQATAPPPPTTFVVFFDFDRSDLTPEAAKVVAQAASIAKSERIVRIVVTGHTDTVGSASYNQRLSERRAATVKAELVADGLTASDIGIIGKGFNDPLVPTGPDVREPQNRRAVIELGPGATS